MKAHPIAEVAPDVSVVVPCFNVASYLKRGMDALLGQRGPSFEVVAVDDGSSDETSSLLDELADRDERVRVIHQANRGVSAARNAGLDICRGRWVAFFDPDDMVEPGWLQSMVEASEGMGADGCICAYREVEEGPSGAVRERRLEFEGTCLDRDGIMERLLPGVIGRSFSDVKRMNGGGDIREGHVESMVWRFLLRRRLLMEHGIRFDERVDLAEDELFVSEVALHAQSLALVHSSCYVYVRRPDSAVARLAYGRGDFRALSNGVLARREIGLRAGNEGLQSLWLASCVIPLFGTMRDCGRRHAGLGGSYGVCREYVSLREVRLALDGFPVSARRPDVLVLVLMMRAGLMPLVFATLYAMGFLTAALTSPRLRMRSTGR